MGKKQSKLKPQTIADLMRMTEFTDAELNIWYKEFTKDAQKGRLSREEFVKLFEAIFPESDAVEFGNHVFRTFDVNNDGVLNFREFVIGLSLSLRGTFDEKLHWAFKVYDVDGNGFISQSEMRKIITAMCAMCRDENMRKLPVEDFFVMFDKDNDGHVSWAEFRKGVLGNKLLTQFLQQSLDCVSDR